MDTLFYHVNFKWNKIQNKTFYAKEIQTTTSKYGHEVVVPN